MRELAEAAAAELAAEKAAAAAAEGAGSGGGSSDGEGSGGGSSSPGCQKSLLPPRAFSLPLIVFGLGWTKKKTQNFSVRERYELPHPAL